MIVLCRSQAVLCLLILIFIPATASAVPEKERTVAPDTVVNIETGELQKVSSSDEREAARERFSIRTFDNFLDQEISNALGEEDNGQGSANSSGGCILWSSPRCVPCRGVDPGVKKVCEVIDPWTEPGKSDPRAPNTIPTVTDQDGEVIAEGPREINDWFKSLQDLIKLLHDLLLVLLSVF